jgi:hypothetical protein
MLQSGREVVAGVCLMVALYRGTCRRRHPREGGDPATSASLVRGRRRKSYRGEARLWIPAFAGFSTAAWLVMTSQKLRERIRGPPLRPSSP